MRAGRALREKGQDETNARKPCPKGCPHLNIQHHELQRCTYALNEGQTEIIEIPNPDYVPFRFHCDVDGCGCWFEVAS